MHLLEQKHEDTEQLVHSATSLPKELCQIVAKYTSLYCNYCVLTRCEPARYVRYFEEYIHVEFIAMQHFFNVHGTLCCHISSVPSGAGVRQVQYRFPLGILGVDWAVPACTALCPGNKSQHTTKVFVDYIGNAKNYRKQWFEWVINWEDYDSEASSDECMFCKREL